MTVVRLSSLLSRDGFALLGPGFGGGHSLLLSDLSVATRDGWPRLVLAPFEAAGCDARVLTPASEHLVDVDVDVPPPRLRAALQASGHADGVAQIRDAIAAGDVYQVCFALRAELDGANGAELFAAMVARGLPRFAAWVRFPAGPEIVSGSPELFFETDGRRIHAEPMKGTAAPSDGARLRRSEKERSELAMITDLVRNDLVPVCRARSVDVPCARRLLELPYALQAVADVQGELLPGVTPLDVLDAVHPGGSVTGAPKRAALAMIRALEPTPRGPFCGALGLWRDERSVFSLLIRTATARPQPGTWTYGVGGGIVYDSCAADELAELRVKLGALGV